MTPPLPEKIAAYFAASNAAEPLALAGLFSDDGEVRDEKETHRGREAIAEWARSTQRQYRMQSTPTTIEQVADDHVVAAMVAGDFPGSPLQLTYRFRLSADGVRRLEIG